MLRPNPTYLHFDPERVFFKISDGEGIENITITYKGLQQNKYRVVPGSVRIQDHKGKVVFAFTFGGDLQIEMEGQEKICTLVSTAPIFVYLQPTILRFIEEVEIILAERRANWENDPHEFETRLAKTEPLILYATCLNHLTDLYEHTQDNGTQHLVHFMKTELQELREEHALPLYIPPISELL
jgi:hypothetical protein